MRAERSFIAERAVAQHCPELLRRAAGPVDVLPLFERLGARLVQTLGPALAGLHGGVAPVVSLSSVRELDANSLASEIAPLAANCLLAVAAAEAQILVSLDAAAVFRLVDRTYGGRGEAPAPLPESFPLSAELLIARLEAQLATALAAAIGVDPVFPLHRDSSIVRLAPFPPAARVAALTLTITPAEGGASWDILLAMLPATIAGFLGHGDRPAPVRPTGAADPAAEPFGEIPLPLTAVLVDMLVSLTAISALEVGMIVPVALARSVPLRSGNRTIAHGTVGALDDCAALQLTQIS